MTLKTILVGLAGGVIGGALVWIGQSGSFQLHPASMSYADLAATLLSAVGVIITIFGGILGIAAIWGFNQLKGDAVNAAANAGAKEIREQIENGPLRDYIKAEIEGLVDEEIDSARMTQRIKDRVDAVAFGQPDKDQLLEEEE
jgi:hypothetical protein